MEKGEYLIEMGRKIKELRIIRGMSQEELAKAVGYTSLNSRSTINKVEAGKADIARSKVPLYAAALGVTVAELMGIEPPKEEKTEDEQLAFALWGDDPTITEQDIEDVRRFAEFLRQKKGEKK